MGTMLDGQAALITGGATGIGRAVLTEFIGEGARVCVMVRDDIQVSEVKDAFGDEVAVSIGDVRNLADNHAAVSKTVDTFGKLDTFVGNAGIWDFITPLENQSADNLSNICDEIFGVNVKGYVLGAYAALPELRKSKGSIIFTASSSSFYTGGGGPIYVASKHAVVGLIKQLARETAPDVRVNGVAPGGTMTPLKGSAAADQGDFKLTDIPGVDDLIKSMTPLGFTAAPEDHAPLYAVLASAKMSKYVTGSVFQTDGGIGVGINPQQES